MREKCAHTYSNPDLRLPCPYCWTGGPVYFITEGMRMRHAVTSGEDGGYRLRSRPVSTALTRTVRYRLTHGAAGERSWQEDVGTTITKG